MVLSVQHSLRLKNEEILVRANQLLSLLPESELQNVLFNSDCTIIRAKKALYQSNEAIEKVYFPIRGIISLVNINKAGLIAEFATVSNEGMIASAAL